MVVAFGVFFIFSEKQPPDKKMRLPRDRYHASRQDQQTLVQHYRIIEVLATGTIAIASRPLTLTVRALRLMLKLLRLIPSCGHQRTMFTCKQGQRPPKV